MDSNQDRFLLLRGDRYYYWRRIPANVEALDERAKPTSIIRKSLKTNDLAKARALRDMHERADNEFWSALIADGPSAEATAKFLRAMRKLDSFSMIYKSVAELAQAPLKEVGARMRASIKTGDVVTSAAILGAIRRPQTTVTQAFKIYLAEIQAMDVISKSPGQRIMWERIKQRSIDSFVAVIGDKAMGDIVRDDGRKFYQHWLAKLTGEERLSASYGNRMIGNMRVLHEEYFKYIGDTDRSNPFEGLRFTDKIKRSRPPFSVEWIKGKILLPGVLAGLNHEARHILYTIIETGARPSEISNLTPNLIRLDADVPHIAIEPRDDPNDPREIKAASSIRTVPLVGVALEAMRRHPDGFPRYKDKDSSLSTAIGKYLRENKLFPTKKHTTYSFRHSFEDRMKEAGVDEELRRILMGHTVDRPKYGSGGSLAWRQQELLKIMLPFDPAIV